MEITEAEMLKGFVLMAMPWHSSLFWRENQRRILADMVVGDVV